MKAFADLSLPFRHYNCLFRMLGFCVISDVGFKTAALVEGRLSVGICRRIYVRCIRLVEGRFSACTRFQRLISGYPNLEVFVVHDTI